MYHSASYAEYQLHDFFRFFGYTTQTVTYCLQRINKPTSANKLEQWALEKAKTNDNVQFWLMVMGLQKHILVFIRSQIQQEFVAYVASLQSLMKYIFAFDRTHYERWLSVDIFDLLRL